jgi:hypothetical protein
VNLIVYRGKRVFIDTAIEDLDRRVSSLETAAETAQAEQQGSTFPERDATKTNAEQGLYRKFDVCRVDGSDAPGGKHYGCEYFVLDLKHDQHAQAALRAYAQSCAETHPHLSADLVARYGEAEQQGDFDPELMRDVAMRTVQAMGLVYTSGADRWKPNIAHASVEQQGDSGAVMAVTDICTKCPDWPFDERCCGKRMRAAEQPSARVALSDAQIDEVFLEWNSHCHGNPMEAHRRFARAILAASAAQTGESK